MRDAKIWDSVARSRAERALVRVARRRIEEEDVYSHGFLLDASTALVLLHKFGHNLSLDGYEVIRLDDITSIDREFPRMDLLRRAIELKGSAPRLPEGISLSDIQSVLVSLQKVQPCFVVERELALPDECLIGRVRMMGNDTFVMRLLSTTAEWEHSDSKLRFQDVTRVGFGGEYESTLAALAGPG